MPDAPRDAVPDSVLDQLYAVRPDEFVATRDRLAKELRADGNAEAAVALRAHRRPNVVAWSVNQVARSRRELLEALFSAADEVRAAINVGDGDALRVAMRAQRTRVGELTDAALERAAEVSPNAGAHREAIAGTWEAGAADPNARQLVLEARLTGELQPALVLGDDPTPARPAPAPRRGGRLPRAADPVPEPDSAPERRRAALPRDELALRRAEDTLAEARSELADAQASVEAADEELERATRAAARAHDAHDRAQRRVTRAEQSVAERRAR
ncbi:MAG: hypothetical protein ABW033_01345 [Acidimicrobiia bacterium]